MFGSSKINWENFKHEMTVGYVKYLEQERKKEEELKQKKHDLLYQERLVRLTFDCASAIEKRLADKSEYRIFLNAKGVEMVGQNFRCLTYDGEMALNRKWEEGKFLPCHSIVKVAQDAGFAAEHWTRNWGPDHDQTGREFVTVTIKK